MNWDSINAFSSVLRFSKDINKAVRSRACNFLLALLQMEEACWSKLSSESIKIPSKLSFVLVLSEAYIHQSGFWNSKVNDIFQDWS